MNDENQQTPLPAMPPPQALSCEQCGVRTSSTLVWCVQCNWWVCWRCQLPCLYCSIACCVRCIETSASQCFECAKPRKLVATVVADATTTWKLVLARKPDFFVDLKSTPPTTKTKTRNVPN
jgi:hypothetical protein